MNMTILNKFKGVLCCTFLLSSLVNASSISDTKISLLMIDQGHGDKIYIKTSKAHQSGSPSCHASSWSFVLPLNTPLQDKMYAMLLAAQTSGKTVNLIGYGGDCVTHASIETLRRIEYK
jgi:hypothetical protein